MEEHRPIEPLGLFGRFKQWLPFEIRIVKIEDEERKKLTKQERKIFIAVFGIAFTTIILITFIHFLFVLLASFIPILVVYLDIKKEKRERINKLAKGRKSC